MIYVIGNAPHSKRYWQSSFLRFVHWMTGRERYQLDIETNVTPWWCDKKIITVQFGADGDQWVLQKSALSKAEWDYVCTLLKDPRPLKLIHNAAFECTVFRFYGVTLENVYDTMLAEKVLNGADEDYDYALADLTQKYVCVTLDKTEQTTFGDDILTENKVVYAAQDVKHLEAIYRMQVLELGHNDLDWVAALENEAVLGYSEMMYYGMELDTEAWLANLPLVEPLIKAAKEKLDAWLLKHPLHNAAINMGFISPTDRLQIKWTAPRTREALLKLLFPEIEGASLGVVRKYIKTHPDHPELGILKAFEQKDYAPLEQILVLKHREYLVSTGQLIPAGVSTINWNSQAQVLPLLKVVEPKLKDLSKDSLAKTSHPIVEDLKEFKDNLKLESSYGQAFIDKFLEPDGKIRTTFNQIVSTGRVSSTKPNMQNIPSKEAVGNRYRNCFLPGKLDFVFVDSDYGSQELVCIAYLSKDPVWIDALEKRQDLHSVAAEVVYGKKWKDGAEPDCAYYKPSSSGTITRDKCKCKKHKTMRQACKTINFGKKT